MPRGGFRVHERDQLHDGPKGSTDVDLLSLVLDGKLQNSELLVRLHLDFLLARLQERMIGRIRGNGQDSLLIQPLPVRRLAQRRQTRLQRCVNLQTFGHLGLPSFFDQAQYACTIGSEGGGASL